MSSEDHPFDPKATETETSPLLPKELQIDVSVSVRCREDPSDVVMLSPKSKNAPETSMVQGPHASMDTSTVQGPHASMDTSTVQGPHASMDTSTVQGPHASMDTSTVPDEPEAKKDKADNEPAAYTFDTSGRLVNVKNGEKFVFTTQKNYEDLGDWVTGQVYKKMTQSPYKLERLLLQDFYYENGRLCGERLYDEDEYSYIFTTPQEQKFKHLVVLIHGSGVVRAGQWTRKLIINEGLDVGSQLPYIRECQKRGWGVIVMNTNDNICYHYPTKSQSSSQNSAKGHPETSEAHGLYVWQKLVQPKCFNDHELKVAIVAHSYGGIVTMEILRDMAYKIKRIDEDAESNECIQALDALKALKCICLTDAIFDEQVASWMKPRAPKIRNWVTSALPLDTKLPKRSSIAFSAGTDEHERTSPAAISSAFKFIEESFSED
ncbi:Cotranscriptional regulator protein [Ditylenchus destructor]|nr:Cotranscriptional regulator protein [Ditylenchus destructor]